MNIEIKVSTSEGDKSIGGTGDKSKANEKSPLLQNSTSAGEKGTQEEKLAIDANAPSGYKASLQAPPSLPFIQLIVPFKPIMPPTLEYEGEELRDKISDVHWNKMITEAAIIGEADQRLNCCYRSYILPYVCFPCFYYCFYKFAEDRAKDAFVKWKAVFDPFKIKFEMAYRPGAIDKALFSGNFHLAPKYHCFVIDIEHVFTLRDKPLRKTPLGTDCCFCACIEPTKIDDSKEDQ